MASDLHDDRRAFGRGTSSATLPDVTTMAGIFQLAWMQLAPLGSIEPLVVLQALPGAWQDDCVNGPDGQPWRLYVFADRSCLLVDGYATRFIAPNAAPAGTAEAVAALLAAAPDLQLPSGDRIRQR